MNKVTISLLTSLLSGCVSQQVTLRATFDQEETARLLAPGKNTIKGSALMRQNNGGTVTCAGSVVTLTPVTDYSTERMQAIYRSSERGYVRRLVRDTKSAFANDNPEYRRSVRTVGCDAQGFFKFENVGDGRYFIITTIQWHANQFFLEGGHLMQKVAVGGGDVKEIVLAP